MALKIRQTCYWFDLDDTLITTTNSLVTAISASTSYLKMFYPEVTERDVARCSMDVWLSELGPGTTRFHMLKDMSLDAFRFHIANGTLMRLGFVGIDIDRLIDTSARAEEQAWTCFDGAVSLLQNLHQQRIPVGLISNGPTALQNQKLATCGIYHYFDHILLDCEVGTSKPGLEIFTEAAARKPEFDHVMVGNDPQADINGALRANWNAYWFTTGWFDETKPSELGYIPFQHHSELLSQLTKG